MNDLATVQIDVQMSGDGRHAVLLDASTLRTAMPSVAAFYAQMAAFDRPGYIVECIKAAIALRTAIDADDYQQVQALFRECKRRRIEPVHAAEAGVELGVSHDEIRAFAARHRALVRAAAAPARPPARSSDPPVGSSAVPLRAGNSACDSALVGGVRESPVDSPRLGGVGRSGSALAEDAYRKATRG